MNGEWNAAATLNVARSRVADSLALMKPGLTLFSVVTALGGAYLAAEGTMSVEVLLVTFLGTFLAGGGAVALNQYRERSLDSLMERTAGRPLPGNRLRPKSALRYGLFLAISGVATLSLGGNLLAGGLALTTIAIYLFLYTPLKRMTPYASVIGAIAGALPPMIGWAIVENDLAPAAWSLFAILFLWQMPHFLSLSVMYRPDYARAGFRTLAVTDPTGTRAARHILGYCLLLLPASVLPVYIGLLGHVYAGGVAVVSLLFLVAGARFFVARTTRAARGLFLASLAYLPLLSVLIVADGI
jgi:protoheme IX farnesyltransferase